MTTAGGVRQRFGGATWGRGPSRARRSTRPGLGLRLWAALVVFAIAVFVPCRARADGPELRVDVDANIVGVGEIVQLTLRAMSQDAPLSSPQPGATPGFVVVGQNIAPSQSVSIVNGVVTQRQGIVATYSLRATALGTHVVGPPSVLYGGKRVTADSVRISVVPPDKAPPRRPRSPFDFGPSPFDPWKGLFGGADDDDDFRPSQPAIPTDPKLALERARDDIAFLHATIDKRRAVVGEQVTLTVYLYIDTSEGGSLDFSDVHEATAADFIKRTLAEEDASKPIGYATVDGKLWSVRLLRRWALFPLKSGELDIGPMSLSIGRRRRGAGPRTSEPLEVTVSEPPVAGRPPGYMLGDVGSFSLSASVTPRAVAKGGAAAVDVELSGTGNLPSELPVPTQAGVEWLKPQVREKLGAVGEKFGGTRTFSYVVRMQKEGLIDLGDIAVPFWDPERGRYDVARVSLGSVDVAANPTAPDDDVGAPEPLANLPKPRGTFAGSPPSRAYVADAPWFWLAVLFPPLGYVLARGGAVVLAKRAARKREQGAAPEAELRERTAEGEAALAAGDAAALDAASSRLLEAAARAHADRNVRGLPAREVADALAEHGIERETAQAFEALLEACQVARFAPGGPSLDGARDRFTRARGLEAAMAKGAARPTRRTRGGPS